MTTPICSAHDLALCSAARRFIRTLTAEAKLQATARVEVRLSAESTAPSLFAIDEALTAAWPQADGARPRQEVIWALGREDPLKLSAFDAVGRVLLRRIYAAEVTRKGAGHV